MFNTIEGECEWSWLEYDHYWITGCGRSYMQQTADPAEIELMGFCPYCGKTMKREVMPAPTNTPAIKT